MKPDPFRIAVILVILACPYLASAQNKTIDTTTASQYFREAREACERDGGDLWGKSVCGPVLFVDPATRMVVANQVDLEGQLVKRDEVFVGRLPERQPIANASLNWAGIRWAMIIWSFLTNDKFQRVKLITHEAFHRIQNELKFPVAAAGNSHLDSQEGRIWLQLEWRALRQALINKGGARRRAIEDALTFRTYRRSLFPKANNEERSLEMHEGLAEYTAFKVSAASSAELVEYLIKQIDQAAGRPTFVAYFAYASGPAYGVLLDGEEDDWLKGLTAQNDLGDLLQRSLTIKLPSDLKARAERQASKYDGDTLRLAESEREAKRQKQIAEYRRRFVDGPTLLIPLSEKRRVAINTSNVVPLEGIGNVNLTATVTDEWGILEVTNGALMSHNEGGRVIKVYVSIPADIESRPLSGDGWTLKLESGWRLAPGLRQGDYTLKRVEH